jgi:hypothetical protein
MVIKYYFIMHTNTRAHASMCKFPSNAHTQHRTFYMSPSNAHTQNAYILTCFQETLITHHTRIFTCDRVTLIHTTQTFLYVSE